MQASLGVDGDRDNYSPGGETEGLAPGLGQVARLDILYPSEVVVGSVER